MQADDSSVAVTSQPVSTRVAGGSHLIVDPAFAVS